MSQDWRDSPEDLALFDAMRAPAPSAETHGRDPAIARSLEHINELFQQTAEPSPYREPTQGKSGNSENVYGRVLTLTITAALTSDVQVVQTPLFEDSREWTVTFQSLDQPNTTLVVAPEFYLAQISYFIGSAQFTKYVHVRGKVAQSISIVARGLIVSITDINPLAAGTRRVAVGVTPGICPAVQRFGGTWWSSDGTAPLNIFNLWTVGHLPYSPFPATSPLDPLAGVLQAYNVTVTNMGGAAELWALFFDLQSTLALAAGAQPMHRSQGMTSAGQNASFDDEFDPSLIFNFGLVMALSSTPTIYTAVPGSLAVVDYKVGG